MPEAAIVFDNVWKKFRRGEVHSSLRDLVPAMVRSLFRSRAEALSEEEFWALREVSFEVKPGEMLGIIGRNGAGKSTTLKLLTRILKPTLGRSIVKGRVGALIELAAGFHPDLTGRENVYLQGAIMGMRRDEIKTRFDDIVDFSGISPFIDTQVKRYSSGMQARLGFSVAAHLSPDVLLIDEVLAVGDLTFQQKCYERLREFRRNGVAIAFVSHNMQAISMLSDRVVYLRPNAPPLTGSVGDMVRAYVTTDAQSTDARVGIQDSVLSEAAVDAPVDAPISPGTRLRLRLSLLPNETLTRAGLAILVHRADGLLVFDGSSLLDGHAPVDLLVNEPLTFEVTFTAHLLRGTYTVSTHVFEEERRWPSVQLGVVGSFVVAETTRAGGIAELAPVFKVLSAGIYPSS